MDTLTVKVIIHLTGLLLLTPGNTPAGPATQILLPQPSNMDPHIAVLVYFAPDSAGCDRYDEGVCYLKLDGRALSIGTPDGNPAPPQMPPGAPNVSRAALQRVPPDRYGTEPSSRLRSRVSLYGAEFLGSCAKGVWDFRDDSLPIPNVVSYQIAHTGNGLVEIRSLQLRSGVRHPREQVVGHAAPIEREVHLFLFHVPPGEFAALEKLGVLLTSAAAVRTSSMADTVPVPNQGDDAEHYRRYYDLIGATVINHRPAPEFLRRALDENARPVGRCPFIRPVSELTQTMANAVTSAGTFSCMVATGTPFQ